jgi:hypothetical protein
MYTLSFNTQVHYSGALFLHKHISIQSIPDFHRGGHSVINGVRSDSDNIYNIIYIIYIYYIYIYYILCDIVVSKYKYCDQDPRCT